MGPKFNLNQNNASLSSQGNVFFNSSGGLVRVVSNNGKGSTIIDTSGAYLNANKSIFSTILNVTPPQYIGRGVSGEMYNETMIFESPVMDI